jgi:hypothetical protein
MVSGHATWAANQALEPTALNRAGTRRGVWTPRLSAGVGPTRIIGARARRRDRRGWQRPYMAGPKLAEAAQEPAAVTQIPEPS